MFDSLETADTDKLFQVFTPAIKQFGDDLNSFFTLTRCDKSTDTRRFCDVLKKHDLVLNM